MKYITSDKSNVLILFDAKNESVDGIFQTSSNIDYLWIAPVNGVIHINGNDELVEAGDIVLRLYSINDDPKREYILLKNDDLKSYYKRLTDYNNAIRTKYDIKESESANCLNPTAGRIK